MGDRRRSGLKAQEMPLILSRKDLRQLLTMADVIEAVERGFREYKAGKCAVPVRMPVKIERAEGIFLFMPAYLEMGGFFGTKIVSVFPRNIEKKLSALFRSLSYTRIL